MLLPSLIGGKRYIAGSAVRHEISEGTKVENEVATICLWETGSDLPCRRERGLTREQVWGKVFERKTVLALEEVLEAEDPNIELPRVIKNAAGKDVSDSEWVSCRMVALCF